MNHNKKVSPLRDCIEFIKSYKRDYIEGDSPLTSDLEEISFEITNERIFEIPECKDFRKLGFVDGGTEPIIKSSDFNISLNRVAGVLFNVNECIQPTETPVMIEFYSATILDVLENGKMEFKTRLFPREPEYKEFLPENDIKIPFNDISIREGRGFLLPIEQFGAIAMRFAEWTYAKKFIENELNSGDIFVRDGSLQTGYTGEIDLANKLYLAGYKKKVFITGLSKSCRIFSENGDSLIYVINSIANKKFPEKTWYYHPIYQIARADNRADLYFVKLHKNSSYPFRFDIYLEQSKALNQEGKEIIISNIANNSNDLSFIGYPYGLIKADQLARISNKEIQSQKIQLLTEFDQEFYMKYILPRLRAVDAHDILNKIRK